MFNPSPCRPHAFRQARLLVVGCGDVGQRVLKALGGHLRVRVLSRDPGKDAALRALGAALLPGDLDDPVTLGRLGAVAPRVLHLAPPPGSGADDPRTTALVRALARGGVLRRLVYGSTTGVYGDAQGAHLTEASSLRPTTDRGRRRVAAEDRLRWYGRASGASVGVLRIPGIYAPDRPGGDPRERLRRGTPVLHAEDDVYTNHIHADDLARACIASLWRGRPQRVVHACDDSQMKMGDYFDLVADLSELPRPRRVSRVEAAATMSPMQLSFWSESRRLSNTRLKRELRLRLCYPTVREALAGR